MTLVNAVVTPASNCRPWSVVIFRGQPNLETHVPYALSTPASGMANRTKVASISASVQRARVHFGEPCNKRAFILAIHLLSVFWRTIKGSYASMLHKVWTVSRAQDCLLHVLTVQALFWKTGEPLVEFPYYLHVFV
jgi:hypothetical protein